PAQVQVALKEIPESAFYLRRSDDGSRYYASLEPSPNVVLSRIYRSLQGNPKVEDFLLAASRNVVKGHQRHCHVVHDVALPRHIPDKKNQPVLALVSPSAGTIDVEAMITTTQPGHARQQQNAVLLLVPNTVRVAVGGRPQETVAADPQKAYEKLADE